MRKLFVFAAVLLASSAAQAGETYNFDVGGQRIHIDPDRGIVSIPGVYESGPKRVKRSHNNSDDDAPVRTAPPQAKVDPQPSPVPAPQASPATSAAPSSASANVPADPMPPASAAPGYTPAPQARQDTTPSVTPAVPMVAVAPVAPPVQQASAASTGPLGVWLTEEKEGKVRIEPCGANLCGYSVNARSDQNGEKVLINMKPVTGGKWSGKIFDPKSGSTYESTIAMKGSDSLRVQGCAFGGMFCGGQTWSRVN